MAHQTFKVSIVIDDTVENFYIKHYVDDFQPIFTKFKNLVFQRNPIVNSPKLKIFWIDAENDKILISCEEDFRLYIEQGKGKKIFFSVLNIVNIPVQQRVEDDVAMEAEESNERQRIDRKTRKCARDEEKQKRAAKRLAEKMRSAEEKVRAEEERCARHPEKCERKNLERLERAKKRCEQFRQIIGSMDPANLNASAEPSANAGASTSSPPSADGDSSASMHPSPETIRLLSNAIAGCLQPCSLINKILNEIIGMVPHPAGEIAPQASNDQQQQTEVPRQNTATNTSDMNTPTTGHPSSQEIEALFKEAAKELEKMNEIVNSSKAMEASAGSGTSSMTGITQVERVFHNITDSAISNATLIGVDAPDYVDDDADGAARGKSPDVEDYYKIVTPPKSMRSRESSIEVHDENSMMSEDSRDWTMLDAIDQEDAETENEPSMPPAAIEKPSVEAVPVPKVDYNPFASKESTPSVSIETQTPSAILSMTDPSGLSQSQSIQKSIETVEQMNEIVKNSVALAQKSLESFQKPAEVIPIQVQPPSAPEVVKVDAPRPSAPEVKKSEIQLPATPKPATPTAAIRQPMFNIPSASTPANMMANRLSTGATRKVSPTEAKWTPPKVGPAVIVYDPNPKINASVHTMINMGFSNEGGWLTQLLINVDGDVPKAINFLTPQPKHKQQ